MIYYTDINEAWGINENVVQKETFKNFKNIKNIPINTKKERR